MCVLSLFAWGRAISSKLTAVALAMMCLVGPAPVLGDQSPLLMGTWVIDAEQTEKYLRAAPLPRNHVEWLPSVLLRMCVTTMTFAGDTLTISKIGPSPSAELFHLRLEPKEPLAYTMATNDGEVKDVIAVSFINEGSITIKSAKMELMEYGVWKRGQKSTPQTGEKDFSTAFGACAAALDNIPFLKKK